MTPLLTLQTPPSTEPITTAEAKTHSRIFITNDDSYIADLIEAAREKWEKDSGYFIATASYQATYKNHCHHTFTLPLRPVVSVDSVNALTVDTDYTVAIDVRTNEAVIKLITPVSGDVVVNFTVGPGESDPPMLARHAVKCLVGHWYENREAFQPGSAFKSVPATYQSIVTSFRLA